MTNFTPAQQATLDKIQLPHDWKMALSDVLLSPVMDKLRDFLRHEYAQGKTIYPPKSQIFNALNTTPLFCQSRDFGARPLPRSRAGDGAVI